MLHRNVMMGQSPRQDLIQNRLPNHRKIRRNRSARAIEVNGAMQLFWLIAEGFRATRTNKMNGKMKLVNMYLAISVCFSATVFATKMIAQSFSCQYGAQPACLDYGDKVCSSAGKCVSTNAVCFDSYQCDFEGFTCKSNVSECVEEYESLQFKYNELVDDYNDLLRDAKDTTNELSELKDCVDWATSKDEAKQCAW